MEDYYNTSFEYCTAYETRLGLMRQAVRKWSLIAVGLGVNHGILNCSLCHAYMSRSATHIPCYWCPVSMYLNRAKTHCVGTPYTEYEEECGCSGSYKRNDRTLANKELMFLQKVLEDLKEKHKKEGEENDGV